MVRGSFVAIVAGATALAAGAQAQSGPAEGASAHLSPQFIACFHRASDNPVQRDVCAQREVGEQDDRLNKAYKRVMTQLAPNPAARTTLREEERRWISERDYACKVNEHTVNEACVVMKTASRADELEGRVRF